MSNAEAVATFLVEVRELFEQIEQGLLDLEHRLDDRALIDSIFRSLHTLKGSGAMFGFEALAQFTHHCEDAFDRIRKGEAVATSDLVSAILAAMDHMRAMVEHPKKNHGATSQKLLAGVHAAIAKALPGAGEAAPGSVTWRVKFKLPTNAIANGINPLALLKEMRDLGPCEIVASDREIPPLDQLNPTECHLTWVVTLTTNQPRSAIEEVFIFVMDDMSLTIESIDGHAPSEPADASAAVAADAAASNITGEQPIAAAETAGSRPAENRTGESVRVPAERLDELMDRVGELVIAQSRLRQLAASSQDVALRSVSEEIERLSNELRNTTMVLRMVPVGTLFSRFRRLVHDISHEIGKTIELTFDGETTEVDKTIAERLVDPLVHLVRNAADHGLESPEQRLAAGKPEAGQMCISAHHAGSEVIISVKDDGRGIDRERVRARAEQQGLLAPGAAIGDSELLQMIFHPGFSTAQKITNLSGRGVGLDVVKRTLETLRGSIDLSSTPGKGTEFSLRIPLTLAIIDGLLVRVGRGRYVVPLSAVEECLELPTEMDLRSQGRNFISLRDSLVPFIRLRELFNTGTPPDRHQKIVVISTGNDRVGLVVDQIIGDHQTVIKSLSKLHADVATFSGATILGDGSVALILDVAQLLALGQWQEAQMRIAG